MLNFIKMMLDLEEDSSRDELLTALIERYRGWLEQHLGTDLYSDTPVFEEALADLVVTRYNRMGSEGLSEESVGTLSMSYEEVPYSVRSLLSSYRRVRF